MNDDYVVCVGGKPGDGWLSLPSDEQDELDLVVTTDATMVARYGSYAEAELRRDVLVAAHPKHEFAVHRLVPIDTDEDGER